MPRVRLNVPSELNVATAFFAKSPLLPIPERTSFPSPCWIEELRVLTAFAKMSEADSWVFKGPSSTQSIWLSSLFASSSSACASLLTMSAACLDTAFDLVLCFF